MSAADNKAEYEELDQLLDKVNAGQADWVATIEELRLQINDAYDDGALAGYQYRALKGKSARVHQRTWLATQ